MATRRKGLAGAMGLRRGITPKALALAMMVAAIIYILIVLDNPKAYKEMKSTAA
jgi:hypothetical protein